MKIDKYSAILGNTVGYHDMSTLTSHRPVASLPFGGLVLPMLVFAVFLEFSNKKILVRSLTIFVQVVSGACLLY